MSTPHPPERSDPHPSLDDLKKRYDPKGSDQPTDTGASVMLRAGSTFVTAIIGGAVFGFGLDAVWPFKPFGVLIGFLAGAGLGFFHLYRASTVTKGSGPSLKG